MKSACIYAAFLLICNVSISVSMFGESLTGIWEGSDRFIEITDEKMRIVLKPYYGFVYESSAWFTAKSEESSEIQKNISLRYPSEKKDAEIKTAIIDGALYLNFYKKERVLSDQHSQTAMNPLEGFWISEATNTGIRLYKESELDGFYGYYFSNQTYARIYYWKTDARIRDISARFTNAHGIEVLIPKFFVRNGVTYTCITGTGSALKNFETGTISIVEKDSSIASKKVTVTFSPTTIVFAATDAEYRKPLEITISDDGQFMAIGKPDYIRSAVSDLESAIEEHNAKRRPGRKPLLEFMSLDFRWDDIERIRNNGDLP